MAEQLLPQQTAVTALIVDDDSQIRSYIRSVLTAEKHFTHEASSGPECIKLYTKHKPDIVFLDINMPGDDGIAVLEQLLAIEKTVYVVMVSGDSTFENVKKSIDNGAKGFIAKPFTGQKFIDAIVQLTKTISETQTENP